MPPLICNFGTFETAMARIFLVGMMGVGKSHWAGKLARKLGIPHYDLDDIIEQEQGMPIAEIFASKGEAGFRQIESATLRRLGEEPDFVMATGGGAPCQMNNMDYMNSKGVTIWLDEPLEIIIGRLKQGRAERPLVAKLSDVELRGYIAGKLQERAVFYRQARYRIGGKEISNATLEQIINNHE